MNVKLLIFTLLASAAFAADETTFDVVTIPASSISELKAAESEMNAATENLRKSAETLKAAQAKRDAILGKIKLQIRSYESDCRAGAWEHSYRRIEIRGGFALISEGQEPCSNTTFATMTGTINSPVVHQ